MIVRVCIDRWYQCQGTGDGACSRYAAVAAGIATTAVAILLAVLGFRRAAIGMLHLKLRAVRFCFCGRNVRQRPCAAQRRGGQRKCQQDEQKFLKWFLHAATRLCPIRICWQVLPKGPGEANGNLAHVCKILDIRQLYRQIVDKDEYIPFISARIEICNENDLH